MRNGRFWSRCCRLAQGLAGRRNGPGGRSNGLFYVLRGGLPWRMLPRDFPPMTTVRHYFYAWRDSGLWGVIDHLLPLARIAGLPQSRLPELLPWEWKQRAQRKHPAALAVCLRLNAIGSH